MTGVSARDTLLAQTGSPLYTSVSGFCIGGDKYLRGYVQTTLTAGTKDRLDGRSISLKFWLLSAAAANTSVLSR